MIDDDIVIVVVVLGGKRSEVLLGGVDTLAPEAELPVSELSFLVIDLSVLDDDCPFADTLLTPVSNSHEGPVNIANGNVIITTSSS